MKRKWTATFALAVVVTGTAMMGLADDKGVSGELHSGSIPVGTHAEWEFPGLARINASQAVHAALLSTPGKVLRVDLENENGFLVYGIEVVTPKQSVIDVKVDAGSGKVLAIDRDQREAGKGDDDTDRENGDGEDGDGAGRDLAGWD